MPTGKKIDKWEKEFDDEFKGENEFEDGDYIVEEQATKIKRFISSLLSSQLKEVRSKIEALQQEFVGKMAIDALIKLSLELEAELSQLAEGKK